MDKAQTLLAAALALALPATASAGRVGWFDEMPERDSLGQVRVPLSPGLEETRLSFGIEAYRAFESPRLLDELRPGPAPAGGGLSLHGEIASRPSGLYAPPMVLEPSNAAGPLFDPADTRLAGFGIRWQHRLDAISTISISAGYSETPSSIDMRQLDVLDTRATLSWRGAWSGTWQPGLTGSIFIGDESIREEPYQRLGRRYYGFSLGGELRIAQDHTPYLSYRLRRSDYAPGDPEYALSPYDDEQAQILAGWKWQVQRNWSLQAEALYGLNGDQLDPYSQDRSRIFFGTRFDFR